MYMLNRAKDVSYNIKPGGKMPYSTPTRQNVTEGMMLLRYWAPHLL